MKEYSKEARKFYNSKKWKRKRDYYIKSQHYICERCGKPALIVHHKTYINSNNISDINILLNETNLEALCLDCHNKEHFRTTERDLIFDINGDPINVQK